MTPLVIKRISEDGLASDFPEVREGMELTHIQGRSASNMSYKDALAKMKAIRRSGQPLVLSFAAVVFEDDNRDIWGGVSTSRFDPSSDSGSDDDDSKYMSSRWAG